MLDVDGAAALIPPSFFQLLADRPADEDAAEHTTGHATEQTAGFPDGASWLQQLPVLLSELAERWELAPDGAAWHGECALVVPVVSRTGPAALKVTWPHREARYEHVVLRRWNGDGAIRLLAADPSRWAMLLERVDGDRDLQDEPMQRACTVIGELVSRLAVPALPQLPTLSAYADRARRQVLGMQSIPRRMVEHARALCSELATDPDLDAATVHTDLHFGNVLAAQRALWLAIDPKPMAAEPAFAVAPALWNRWSETVAASDARKHLRFRLEVVCEAGGIDPDRARAWTIVREVLRVQWLTSPTGTAAHSKTHPYAAVDLLTRSITIIKAMQQ